MNRTSGGAWPQAASTVGMANGADDPKKTPANRVKTEALASQTRQVARWRMARATAATAGWSGPGVLF